jgi:hypothetical protein
MTVDTIPRRDDLGLLYRRLTLTDNHGVTFTQYRPEIPDSQPRYPLRWIATWTEVATSTDDQDHEREAGPLPLPQLIPDVEKTLGIRPSENASPSR